MAITKDNGIPKYIQLKETVLADIRGGGYKAGDKFLTERELMRRHNLSYATVTHAIKDMAREGFFIRKKSLGTFVTDLAVGRNPDKVMASTLYINDISSLCDRLRTPLSWYPFDQIQKGVINTYNGPVKIVPMEEILRNEEAISVLINPGDMEAARNARGKNIIVNLRHDVRLDFNSVTRDVLMSVVELMNMLVSDLGHSRIAFIGGNTTSHHSLLYAGYEIALRTHNIPLREEYLARGLVGSEEDGCDAMKKFLALPDPPTAVFADTDIKAFGAVRAIKEAGLSVPGDISVAGYGYIPETDSCEPPLTTVKVPFYEMGGRAVELLLERIGTGGDVRSVTLQNTLLSRGSCAKAKHGGGRP